MLITKGGTNHRNTHTSFAFVIGTFLAGSTVLILIKFCPDYYFANRFLPSPLKLFNFFFSNPKFETCTGNIFFCFRFAIFIYQDHYILASKSLLCKLKI